MKVYKELTGRFGTISKENMERASHYIVLTGNDAIDYKSIINLELLRENVVLGVSNDISKYNLGESLKTTIQWTINARSLQNFFSLRSDKSALWEIRKLAFAIYESLPDEHRYLFINCISSKSLSGDRK